MKSTTELESESDIFSWNCKIPISKSPLQQHHFVHCTASLTKIDLLWFLEYLHFGWIQNFPFPLLFLLVELDNSLLSIKTGQSSPQIKILALPKLFFGVIVLHFGCSLIWFDSEMAPTRGSLRPLLSCGYWGNCHWTKQPIFLVFIFLILTRIFMHIKSWTKLQSGPKIL